MTRHNTHAGPSPSAGTAGAAARWPGHPGWPPEEPGPFRPGEPPAPWTPGPPPGRRPGGQEQPSYFPVRAWPDGGGDWQGRVHERLLERRVVMAHGLVDDQAATMLCAQLLTLDATGDDPIRLELVGLDSELAAALTVMDAIDAAGVPVHAYVSGQITGPALGILAAAGRRLAYPHAGFHLTEPRAAFDGTASELSSRGQQLTSMLDALYFRLADVTGREVDEIRDDARGGRFLTVDEAIGYRLVDDVVPASAGPPDAPR